MTTQGAIRLLSSETTKQREDYYTSVVKYETKQLDETIKLWNNRDQSSDKRYWRLEGEFNRATRTKAMLTTNTLKWLKDSEEYFNSKIAQAVLKLESFGFLDDDIMMDVNHAELEYERGLQFYIEGTSRKEKKRVGRVSARLVWVSCYEKRSHYRWIVTFKKA